MSLLHNHPNPETTSTTMCPACLNAGAKFTQRAARGFSDEDVWSFDHYLAGVIAEGLKVLRDNLHGCPTELCEEGDDWATEGVKRWQAILDEMALGFRMHYEDRVLNERPPELQRSLELLAEWWEHLWD